MDKIITKEEVEYWLKLFSKNTKTYTYIFPKIPIFYNNILSNRLDLHGYTVQESYIKTKEFLEISVQNKRKFIYIITGKSGKIFEEFERWSFCNVSRKELLKSGGGYKIYLKIPEDKYYETHRIH